MNRVGAATAPRLVRGALRHGAIAVTLVVCGIATEAQAQLSSSVYASGFTTPIAFVQDPTDPAVQLVVEQGGRVRVVYPHSAVAGDFRGAQVVRVTLDSGI